MRNKWTSWGNRQDYCSLVMLGCFARCDWLKFISILKFTPEKSFARGLLVVLRKAFVSVRIRLAHGSTTKGVHIEKLRQLWPKSTSSRYQKGSNCQSAKGNAKKVTLASLQTVVFISLSSHGAAWSWENVVWVLQQASKTRNGSSYHTQWKFWAIRA